MIIPTRISSKQIVQFFSVLAIVALFAWEMRTYLVGKIPISIISSSIFLLFLSVILTLYLIPNQTGFLKKIKVYNFDFLILLFFIIYGFRVVFNIYIEKIPNTTFESRPTYLVYLLFAVFAPYVLSRGIPWKDFNIFYFINILIFTYIVGMLISISGIISMLSAGGAMAWGRFWANDILEPIGYGHSALVLTLLCISRLYNPPSGKLLKSFVLIGLVIGLVSMALANSRSPFFALFLIFGILFIRKINLIALVLIIILLIILALNINNIDAFFNDKLNSNLINRVKSIFDFSKQSSSGRYGLYKEGLTMFLEKPLFGNSIVLRSEGGLYVHNSLIEAFMATGFFGGVVFFIVNALGIKYSIFLIKIKSKYIFFAFLFLQQFVFSMFSRCLLLLPMYWGALACIYTMYRIEKRNFYEIPMSRK